MSFMRNELVLLRMRRGLTKQELGEKAGLHRTTITAIEAIGTKVCDLTLVKVAEALGVDLDEVLAARRNKYVEE